MPLSLDDVLNAPTDPTLLNRHLQTLGLVPAPMAPTAAAPAAPTTVAPMAPRTMPTMTPPVKTHETVHVTDSDPGPTETSHAEIGSLAPHVPITPMTPLNPAGLDARQPETATPDAVPGGIQPMVPPTPSAGSSLLNAPRKTLESFKSREQDAPDIDRIAPVGQGPQLVEPGTYAYDRNKIDRMEDEKHNHYGTPENHPGVIGKILHGLAKAGNIAGDIVAPGTMALIPGTDLNKRVEEGRTSARMEREQAGETAKAAEEAKSGAETSQAETAKKKEESEEPLREAQTKAIGQKDSEALAKLGVTRNADGDIVPDPTSPAYQKQQLAGEAVKNLMDLRNAQGQLAEAREEVERAKNDPNSPVFKAAQKKLAMAQYAHDIAARNLNLHEREFQNKVQEQELIKPGGQPISRAAAARSALNVIPSLQELINKHREDIGPVVGRIARGEIAIGNVDPEIAQVYTEMESFNALQPSVHGFRNAEFVKDWKTALGSLERDPDAFLKGLEGLRPTLEAVEHEGRVYHKRVVEGRDEKAGAGAAPAAGGGAATGGKTYTQADVDAAAKQFGKSAEEIEKAFKAKNYTKQP